MWLAFTLRNGRCFFADLSFRFPVVARAPGLNVEANLIDVVEMREPDAGWGAARGEVQADGAQSSAREPDPQFVSMQDGGFLDQRKRQPFVDNLIGSVKGERLCSWLEFGAVLFGGGAQEQALQLIEPDGVLESNPGQTRKTTRHELMGSDFRLRCEHGSPLHAIARSMRLMTRNGQRDSELYGRSDREIMRPALAARSSSEPCAEALALLFCFTWQMLLK